MYITVTFSGRRKVLLQGNAKICLRYITRKYYIFRCEGHSKIPKCEMRFTPQNTCVFSFSSILGGILACQASFETDRDDFKAIVNKLTQNTHLKP